MLREQRFRRSRPCPICGGGDDMPRGRSVRCHGFLSDDGAYAHCSRDEHAGQLEQDGAGTYSHSLHGPCGCGLAHGDYASPAGPEPEAIYVYRDRDGRPAFEVVRRPGKRFLQRQTLPGHPAADAHGYVWSLGDDARGIPRAERVPYRLDELWRAYAAGAELLHIAEGERDVDAIWAAGGVATCNPGGAGKWRDTYTAALPPFPRAVVIADRDEPGLEHARHVAVSLATRIPDVRIAQAAEGKDTADHLAAGHTLDELVPVKDEGTDTEPLPWQPVPIADAAGAEPRRQPDRFGGLVYGAGGITLLSGEPGVGKSLLLMAITAEEAIAGRRPLYLDFGGSPGMLLDRLHAAGLSDEQLTHILYLRPRVQADPAKIRALVADLHPSLVAIDSYDAALAAHGLETKNEDIRALAIELLDPLRSEGAALVIADHVTKDREKRGRYTIGGQAKLALCDAHLGLTPIVPLRRGSGGKFRVTVHKDWHGHLPRAATLDIASHPTTGALSWTIRATDDDTDDGGGFRPTGLMERVSRALEIAGEPMSRAQLELAVKGKRDYVRQAIDTLAREEYVEEIQGARGARLVELTRPYREADE